MATPLFAALIVIETSDIMFAVDSVPAILSVTTDTFIVFTSNAFAIMGLRSLYFLLAGLIDRFEYLKYGLAALLAFAGIKLLLSDVVHIDVWVSLGAIVGILGVSVAVSLFATRGRTPVRPTGRGRRCPTVGMSRAAHSRILEPAGILRGARGPNAAGACATARRPNC